MELLTRALNKYRAQKNKKRFNKVAKQIRTTKPLDITYQEDIVIVSQIYHDAIDMSLLALKSFGRSLTRGRFELIDDGSLTDEDYKLLESQLPKAKIIHINDIDVGKCPKGGTWERLIHIINLSKNAYVIQVDTDTLTIGAVPEIDQYVRLNQAFTIGGPMWPDPVSLDYMSEVAKSWKGWHVQVKTEEYLSSVKSIPLDNYLRGCSAFTGFPKGAFDFNKLELFSLELEKEVGKEKWHEWGSEQISSCIMISLCENAQILSWPKYMNYGFPSTNSNEKSDFKGRTSVIHFIGSNRYNHRLYELLAQNVIKSL
jgi:hypothetical protein